MNRRFLPPRGRNLVLLFGVVVLALNPPARADEIQRSSFEVRLAVGSRTRIVLADAKRTALQGHVRAVDANAITLETFGGAAVRVPRDEIGTLQISTEEKRNTAKGALIGAGSAALLGAVFGAAVCGSEAQTSAYYTGSDCTRTEGALLLGGYFASGGAFWGAILGHRSRSDRWTDLPLTQASFAASSTTGAEAPLAAGPQAPAAAISPITPLKTTPLPNTGSRLFAGSRVRVLHGRQKTEGLLMDISPAAVVLGASAGTVRIARDTVEGIETWAGERRRPLKGALIGLVAGFALDFSTEPYCSASGAVDLSCSRAQSASETALGGAVVGAGIGLLVRKTTWIPVHLEGPAVEASESKEGPKVDLTPILPRGGRGAGLRLSVAW